MTDTEKQEKIRERNRLRMRQIRKENPNLSKEQARIYREKYPERVKETAKKYQLNHPEKGASYRKNNKEKEALRHKLYQEKNKDKIKAYHKQHRLKNLDALKQKSKEYYVKNKDAVKKRTSERNMNNREQLKVFKAKNRYGISPKDYFIMMDKQDSKCAICHRGIQPWTKKTHIDHDHKRNTFRGLLCADCNKGIGLLQDDITVLERAIQYLKPWKEINEVDKHENKKK